MDFLLERESHVSNSCFSELQIHEYSVQFKQFLPAAAAAAHSKGLGETQRKHAGEAKTKGSSTEPFPRHLHRALCLGDSGRGVVQSTLAHFPGMRSPTLVPTSSGEARCRHRYQQGAS